MKNECDMKKNAIVFLMMVLFVSFASANTRGLEKYAPRYSYVVIGADFSQLHDNEIFRSLEEKGQIWSYDDNDSQVGSYLRILKIDPKTDISGLIFSEYLNSYGKSGKLHVLSLTRDVSRELKDKPGTPYLKFTLYRLDPAEERYAVLLTPTTLGIGNLNEVKM